MKMPANVSAVFLLSCRMFSANFSRTKALLFSIHSLVFELQLQLFVGFCRVFLCLSLASFSIPFFFLPATENLLRLMAGSGGACSQLLLYKYNEFYSFSPIFRLLPNLKVTGREEGNNIGQRCSLECEEEA